jgi:hypothetical protein
MHTSMAGPLLFSALSLTTPTLAVAFDNKLRRMFPSRYISRVIPDLLRSGLPGLRSQPQLHSCLQ